MKQQHFRFKILCVILVLMLVVTGAYGVYSVLVYGTRWSSSTRNIRNRNAKSNVIPGDIKDRNGQTIASTDENGNRVYLQDLESRSSLVHLLGDSEGNVANAVESFQANYLLGMKSGFLENILPALTKSTLKGDTLKLTTDASLHHAVYNDWYGSSYTKNRNGAVIVMNYQTGEVLCLMSFPVYDPENITDEVKQSNDHPFWNRATQSLMPPGSTFKIVTAAAALSHMKDAEERVFTCTGALPVGEHSITDYGNEIHGELNLQTAFVKSCNNTFAQIALEIGDRKLRAMAESFGFNDNFQFRDLVVENSSYPTQNRDARQIAWSGVGQSAVVASPLHMCMIASAIANKGVMMEPYLVSEIYTSAGLLRESRTPSVYRTACTAEIAQTIGKYMKQVVSRGTGTGASVTGLTIAGKTGSAESTLDGKAVTHAWFVGYIENENLPYAVCVFVEQGGSGGKAAAPIARQIFSYLKEYAAQTLILE